MKNKALFGRNEFKSYKLINFKSGWHSSLHFPHLNYSLVQVKPEIKVSINKLIARIFNFISFAQCKVNF